MFLTMTAHPWPFISALLANISETLGLGQLCGQLGWIAVIGFPLYNFFALRFGNGLIHADWAAGSGLHPARKPETEKSILRTLKNSFDENFFQPIHRNHELKVFLFLVITAALWRLTLGLPDVSRTASEATANVLKRLLGASAQRKSYGWGGTVLFSVSMVLSLDFAFYLQHRLFHQFEPFWEFHKVHHSAERLSPWTTCFRNHIIEDGVVFISFSGCVAIVTALFSHFYAPIPREAMIAGVSIYAALKAFQNAVLHNHVWSSWGKLELVFNSPAMHILHHSSDAKHFNINYGNFLSIFDRLFGSFHPSSRIPAAKIQIGVNDGFDWGSASLAQIYFRPAKQAALSVSRLVKAALTRS